jgi:AraC-like DNA-binding protein
MKKAVNELRFSDAEEAAAAFRVGRPDIVALEPASKPWSVGYARFAESTLWWGTTGAKSAVEGTLRRDVALIAFSFDANEYGVNTVKVGRDRAIFLPAGSDYGGMFPRPSTYCFLSAAEPFLRACAQKVHGGGFDLGHAFKGLDLEGNPARVNRAFSIARNFALAHPDHLALRSCRTSLQAALISAIYGALRLPPAGTDRRDPTLARRLVAYLREHPRVPIQQNDLCVALDTSERSLRRIFPELFGCTPSQYLRMRRMRLARRALLSGQCRSVTDAAVRFGFFDLGRFAGTYRAIFGEPPSASLRALQR